MRLYTVVDEVRVGVGHQLRDWTRAGLLSTSQSDDLHRDLVTDLRRTGLVLRIGLALFTVIAGAAAIGLVFLGINMNSEITVSIACFLLGVGALLGATVFARDLKWYRHGVEEALAVGAIGLFGFSVAIFGFRIFTSSTESVAVAGALGLAAGAAAFVYRRFGFQYAAIGAMCAAALVPTPFSSLDEMARRMCAAAVCGATFVLASRLVRGADSDVSRNDAEVLRAAATAGAYLALNVEILGELFGRHLEPWFRWGTYVVTWVLPLVVGRLAVRERDPLLLRVALAAGLASTLTNKSYLGWARQPWDPMVLGLVLVSVAVLLKRWLSSGPGAERNGFKARQLVESDAATIRLVSLASVAVPQVPASHHSENTGSSFSGGRSGGGGGGNEF